MIAYLDSSILARAYLVDEDGYEDAVALLDDPKIALVTGTWTRIEVSGALVRAARAGRGDEKGLLALLDADLSARVIVLRAPQDEVEQHALELVRRHALRAMDAWHLAVAAYVVHHCSTPASSAHSPHATSRNASSPRNSGSPRSKQRQRPPTQQKPYAELWAEIMAKPIVLGRGENPINFVSVGDVAAVVESAVIDPELRGKVLEVGGPQNATFNELAEMLQQIRGHSAPVRHIPRRLLRSGAPFSRRARAALAMDSIDMTFDAAPARRAFAEIPTTEIRSALTRAVG